MPACLILMKRRARLAYLGRREAISARVTDRWSAGRLAKAATSPASGLPASVSSAGPSASSLRLDAWTVRQVSSRLRGWKAAELPASPAAGFRAEFELRAAAGGGGQKRRRYQPGSALSLQGDSVSPFERSFALFHYLASHAFSALPSNKESETRPRFYALYFYFFFNGKQGSSST